MDTIIIVGGGFCGTVLAANLLRRPPRPRTRVVLVERQAEVGRGAAYARRGNGYLLNVPAGRMSASTTAPLQFVEFARQRDPSTCPERFLPREWYGDYLQQVLHDAARNAPHGTEFETVRGEATSLAQPEQPRHGPQPWRLDLADGRALEAATVVLACGNPPPGDPRGASALATHPRYIADPCNTNATRVRGSLLLIGTGLTMADTALAAAAQPDTVLHAISRHGLLPTAQPATHDSGPPLDAAARDSLLASAGSVRTLLRNARRLAQDAERDGGDWRDVITALREAAPEVWERFADTERRRFLRHLRCYWDLHRHRLPPTVAAQIAALRDVGRLRVHAGRITTLRAAGDNLRVTWRPRGSDTHRNLDVDWIMNCTGPDYDVRRSAPRLLQSALAAGLAAADERGLGLRTGRYGAVLDAGGKPTPDLYYLGPMLRAAHWEATAVGELRAHAEQLAAHLVTTARPEASQLQ